MLIQSCVLIAMMLGVDLVIRTRVRAVVRYWLWMLVMVKLVLPTSLTLPMSVGYWVGLDRSAVSIPMQEMPRTMSPLAQSTPTPEISIDRPTSIEPPVISAITQELKTPPTVQIHQPPPAIDWRALIFLGWLAIAAAMALLVIQRYGFVKGLIRQSRDAEGKTAAIFDECVTQMNLLKKPILKISPSMVSPAACGLLHPVVILPELMITNLNEKEMRAVLLHELTHIGRGDLWINCIQTFLQMVYFYNPLLWPANSVIRRLREQAVDETVLVTLREEAEDYPRTLVNVAKLAMARPALSLRLVGVVESKSALADRIKHMLSRPFPKSSKLGGLALTGIFILAALLLPMAKGERKKQINTSGNNILALQWIGIIDSRVDHKIRSISKPVQTKSKGYDAFICKGDEFLKAVRGETQNGIIYLKKDMRWFDPSPDRVVHGQLLKFMNENRHRRI